MSFELLVRPEAEADVLDAFRWYNDQVPGLGQEFLVELDDAFESIRANPEASRKIHREFRRALTRRFPYSVYYVVRGERIVVFAVLHAARDPRLRAKRARNAR